jgi:chromosome partitioning protein
VNELGRAAILASDLVLIPVQPSPYDVWAATETVTLIREAQQFKPDLKGVFVINRKVANTAIGRDVAAALGQFEDIPVLPTSIGQRVIFAESAGQGLAVIEAEPSSEAAREIATLAQHLIKAKERKAA